MANVSDGENDTPDVVENQILFLKSPLSFISSNRNFTPTRLEKTHVRLLFDSIAHRYDLLNHLLSGGIDFYWRRRAIEHLCELKPRHILDVATGTADFAIAAMRLNPTQIIGVDISERMLELGREKIRKRNLDATIALEIGEAEQLRFETGSLDVVIVGFGVRNFEDLDKGLHEIHRVLRPGGKVVILEFSRPSAFLFKQIYLSYFQTVLPFIGRTISKHPHAYEYLRDTVMKFPEGNEFLAILQSVGFRDSAQERLSFGITTIYTGRK